LESALLPILTLSGKLAPSLSALLAASAHFFFFAAVVAFKLKFGASSCFHDIEVLLASFHVPGNPAPDMLAAPGANAPHLAGGFSLLLNF
jgi:hypothetical protein